jgi:hypothetical protein
MNEKPINKNTYLRISEDENIIILTLPDGTKERHETFLNETKELLCGPGKCSLHNKGVCRKIPCLTYLRKDGLDKGFRLIKKD